jgi:hypothetical protein
MVRVSSLLTIALLLLYLAPAPSRAQLAVDSTRAADAVIPTSPSPQVTLTGWADRRHTDLLDRRFAFGASPTTAASFATSRRRWTGSMPST